MEIIWNKLVTTKVVKEERDLEDLSKKELIELIKELNNKNKSPVWIWKTIQQPKTDVLKRNYMDIKIINECKHDYRNGPTDYTWQILQCSKCWHYTTKLQIDSSILS